MTPRGRTDAELVADILAGQRDGFADIVRRYQTLVCSLAYSATGDLARSEDLAQDTFLAVWRELPGLRDPEKLRAWICSIARRRIQESIRSGYREPTHRAETLDRVDTAPAPDDLPSDRAISEDEAGIVWRALAQLPEAYREPLILFHRENESVAQVAALLDLSEDAVKQRLVRGRKLLQAEVKSLIEGALRRTAPGPVFTSTVMGALPVAGLAAANITAGTAAATKAMLGAGVGGAAKSLLASPFVPIVALLFDRKRLLGYEAAATSPNECELLATHRKAVMRLMVIALIIGVIWGNWFKRLEQPVWFAALIPILTILPLFALVGVRVSATRSALARIWARRGEAPVKRSWEYRSRRQWLGCPLVHIRLGFDPHWSDADRPVKAWIAVGHIAHGFLVAFGQVAIAPVSFGAFAVGIVSVGGLAVGVAAAGALLGVGGYAVGSVAVGWSASGVLAVGLHAAHGCDAYAGTFAASPAGARAWSAFAPHANDAAAREFIAADGFLSRASALFQADRCTAITLLLAFLPWAVWEVGWEIMKGRRPRPGAGPEAGLHRF